MKTKKYVLAFALFGGMLFAVQATNIIDLNGQSTTQIEKAKITVPKHG